MSKLQAALAATLVLGLAASGAWGPARRQAGEEGGALIPRGAARLAAAPPPVIDPPPAEDPLPDGATSRFGSPRYRHVSTIEGIAVSPDGRVAVACSGTLTRGLVRAYDLTTGLVRFTLDRETGDVIAVAISPDGRTLATTSASPGSSGRVDLYDMADGKRRSRIPYAAVDAAGLASDVLLFTPNGTQVIVKAAGGSGLLRIDLARGEVVRTYPNGGSVFAAALSPDGGTLVAGGFDYEEGERTFRRWDVDSGRELGPLPSGEGVARRLAYAPDGATLAVGFEGRDSALRLIDAVIGEVRSAIPFPGASTIRSLAFSPDGGTLAASEATTTRLFDVVTGRERLRIERGAIGLRFAADGATLVGAVAGAVGRWDVATGRSLIPPGGESPVAQVQATADGQRLVSRGQDGDGHVWDVRTGEHLARLEMTRWRGFALGPDGRFLVWPEADATIRFPDLDRPGESHEGSRLRMLDLAKGVMVDRFAGFEGSADDLYFEADGETLVTVDHNRRYAGVRVWDVATGRVERYFAAFGEPGSRVRRSRLSPDGKALAVAYDGADRGLVPVGSAKLWDVETGEELPEAPGRWFDDGVTAFAPGGRTVATASFDGSIQIRDAATWRAIGELRDLGDRPTALGFGPDGRLFSGARDGTVLAWDPRAAKPPAGPR